VNRAARLWKLAPLALVALVATACDSDGSPLAPLPPSVADVVEDTPTLSTLQTALEESGLLPVLGNGGPFTLFAPSNAAFQALPSGTLEAILADPDLLESVLLNHVVQGAALSGSLSDGQQITTLGGGTLTVSIQGGTVRIDGAAVVDADLEASNGVVHVIDAVLVPETPEPAPDLVDVALEAGFGTLVAAVQAAGLEEVLRGDGPFTVFAPTDAAFEALPEGALEGLLADPEALAAVLTYHVVAGEVRAGDLVDGQIVTTVEGRPFRITLNGGAQVNGVDITATDVEARNGVIHVIDAVLLPVEDNVDTAVAGGFETLVAAVQAADLEGVLRSEGPFTIFAPTDAAFGDLPEGLLEELLADPAALADILTYHVIEGRVFASDLADGLEVTTVQGATVTISLNGGARVNDATITGTDILTSNGVIHVIDAVLVPETPEPAPDLVDVALEAGFGTLVAAVQAAGLEEVLRGDGPFTVFAPTDAAFEALPEGALEGLLADPEALAAVLTYHVVAGEVRAGDLVDGQIVTTVEGRPFRITLNGGAQVNGVDITATDVEARNGVIHVIDAVLLPVEDNVDTAVAGGFETLVAAVQAADLEGVLRSEGPFTIFAPTDAAFGDLPEGLLEELLADPEALAGILTYHVIEGRVFASDLADGLEVTTVQGATVTISLNGGAQVNGANITGTDILTSNGVIHVIDAVLVP
jgi:uncharacterized surface protein with fasciclin (FAS1) repeats